MKDNYKSELGVSVEYYSHEAPPSDNLMKVYQEFTGKR